MVTKICSKKDCFYAGIEQDISHFRLRKEKYENICKDCNYRKSRSTGSDGRYKVKRKEKYYQNKDEINSARKIKRDANKPPPKPKPPKQSKDDKLAKISQWTKNNPEKRQASVSKYHENNKEKERQYKIDNKDKISEKNKVYRRNNRDKRNSDLKIKRKEPLVKLRLNVSNLIRWYITSSKNNKSCMKYLQFTIEELKIHLENQFEPWMTWENNGRYIAKSWYDNDQSTWTWQLDHIIPQSDLLYSSMEDDNFKKCWALSNLRPLSAKQNILDGASRIRHANKRNKKS